MELEHSRLIIDQTRRALLRVVKVMYFIFEEWEYSNHCIGSISNENPLQF